MAVGRGIDLGKYVKVCKEASCSYGQLGFYLLSIISSSSGKIE